MKSSYAGWVVAGLLLVLICTVGAMQQQGQVGRYQLVQGRYWVSGGENPGMSPEQLLLFDTATGDTRAFYVSFTGESSVMGWGPVFGKAVPVPSTQQPAGR